MYQQNPILYQPEGSRQRQHISAMQQDLVYDL